MASRRVGSRGSGGSSPQVAIRGCGHRPDAPSRVRTCRTLNNRRQEPPDCICFDFFFFCVIEFPNFLKLPLLCTVPVDQVCIVICPINCLSPAPTGDDSRRRGLLETHTAVRLQSSSPEGVAGAIGHIFSYAGHLLVQTLQRIGASGWSVLKTLLSVLWLAVVAPGGYFGFLC